MYRLYISEILEDVKKQDNDIDKANVLTKNASSQLQTILFANFNPNIIFLLPPTPTPYKPSQAKVGVADTSIKKEIRKLYLFYKGGHLQLSQAKREQTWIQLLESLAQPEAEVMESLKNKSLEKTYGVTEKCVALAYPKLWDQIVRARTIHQTNTVVTNQEKTELPVSAPALDKLVEENPIATKPLDTDIVEAKPKKKRGRKPKAKVVEDIDVELTPS